MPVKKSELYSSLWASCDELRGGMDASQYKDYVLVLLFVKYVSDKYAGQKDALLDVPQGGRFADMVTLKGDKEIGDKINKIIAKLAEADDLKGVIDVADFNDADKLGKGKEMVDRLTNLVSIFDNPALDFSGNRAEGDDLLGDAYEYLMRHFATESGKSKGQFYTPAEVSRVMAKVVGVGSAKSANQTIHDPTCGSGSLLLKAHDEAKGATGHDLALYGQEMDNATAALARMNMILHHCPTAEIWKDNVLASPHFKAQDGRLKTFDFVVANPPFSFKAWSNGFDPNNDEFKRFEFGIPPQKNGDLAFVLHILTCLKSTGKAAVNLPHGVLFRGGAEAAIRREIVRRGYIKGIIGLPANLFYGTGIPACILVLDKENAAARKGIFMIDASKGFIKDGNKNRLRAQDIHKIVDTFTRLAEVPRYSRMVSLAEVSDPKNDFNLNLPRYIDSTEPEDLQDIDAPTCAAASLTATLTTSNATGRSSPASAPRCSRKPTAPATVSSGSPSRTSSPPSSATRNSPPSTNPPPGSSPSGRRPTPRACEASPRAANPRRSSKRSPRTCSTPSRRPGCSTPTTCINTSWTTGPRPCRTTFT
jgi:type I restriction enzyme M protein